MTDSEEIKKNLLDFVSSELTAHAAAVVGLSVLFFASADLFGTSFLPKFNFSLTLIASTATLGYTVAWLSFWILSTGVFYSFMRLTFYGAFAHEIITIEETIEKLSRLRTRCEENLGHKGIINWYSCGLHLKSRGFLLSVVIGFAISLVMFIVLFVN